MKEGDGVVGSVAAARLRLRWMKNAARATRERMMHPPTVPPMMGPRLVVFVSPVEVEVEVEVGEDIGEADAVTVMTIADGVDVVP